jgi:hypothetical protein
VLRVKGLSLKPASFADSSKLVQGDIVMAIGNPLGLQTTVSEGIVSAVGRTVPEPGGSAILNAIQTTAAINPGNSGGALAGLDGKVVGIPTLAATDPQLGGAAVGIGFAIPANTVTDIAGQIVRDGKVTNFTPRLPRGHCGRHRTPHRCPGLLGPGGGPGGGSGHQARRHHHRSGRQAGHVIGGAERAGRRHGAGPEGHCGNQAPDGSTATVTVTIGQYPR